MSAHRPRILVIDDEPQIHRFLGPALEAAGYEPVRADTGAEGLQAMAQRPPDAVVLDLGLPDIDGKQALVRARAFYEGPIVILSATSQSRSAWGDRLARLPVDDANAHPRKRAHHDRTG